MDDETRAYLDEMRRELAGRFDAVDRRFDGVDQHFDGVDRRLEALERYTRRSGIEIEVLRDLFRTVADGVAGNANAIASLRLEMLAGFQGRDVVVLAAFAEVRRDIEDLRQRL